MSSMTLFILFVSIIALLFLFINLVFAPHNPYQEKYSVFECGFHSFFQTRLPFNIGFFIYALVYLLLDLEVLLVFPFTVSGYNNNIYGLFITLLFVFIITIGFVFELGKGALKISSKQNMGDYSKKNWIKIFLTKIMKIKNNKNIKNNKIFNGIGTFNPNLHLASLVTKRSFHNSSYRSRLYKSITCVKKNLQNSFLTFLYRSISFIFIILPIILIFKVTYICWMDNTWAFSSFIEELVKNLPFYENSHNEWIFWVYTSSIIIDLEAILSKFQGSYAYMGDTGTGTGTGSGIGGLIEKEKPDFTVFKMDNPNPDGRDSSVNSNDGSLEPERSPDPESPESIEKDSAMGDSPRSPDYDSDRGADTFNNRVRGKSEEDLKEQLKVIEDKYNQINDYRSMLEDQTEDGERARPTDKIFKQISAERKSIQRQLIERVEGREAIEASSNTNNSNGESSRSAENSESNINSNYNGESSISTGYPLNTSSNYNGESSRSAENTESSTSSSNPNNNKRKYESDSEDDNTSSKKKSKKND